MWYVIRDARTGKYIATDGACRTSCDTYEQAMAIVLENSCDIDRD